MTSRTTKTKPSRLLKGKDRSGSPQALLAFSGSFPPEDLAEMQHQIEQGCEGVEPLKANDTH